MNIIIDPQAKELIKIKGEGAFVLELMRAQGWGGGLEQPVVSLGKPSKEISKYVPIDIDGVTMYKDHAFGNDLNFRVAMTKFLFFKMLRLEAISSKN